MSFAGYVNFMGQMKNTDKMNLGNLKTRGYFGDLCSEEGGGVLFQ